MRAEAFNKKRLTKVSLFNGGIKAVNIELSPLDEYYTKTHEIANCILNFLEEKEAKTILHNINHYKNVA